MSNQWTNKKLSDLAVITMGQSPKSKYYNNDKVGLPFFQGCSEFSEYYPLVKKYCSKPNRLANIGDILMSVRAPVGALNIANQKCCIGRGLCAITSLENSRFLFYLLKYNILRIQSFSGGSTYQSINKSEINNLIFTVPNLSIQQKIASILSTYDKLIENNTRRIAILEEMAQRIYKEWFVDFKYPGHENNKLVDSELGMIPEGWEVEAISEKIFFQEGPGLRKWQWKKKGIKVINVKNILKNGSINTNNTDRYISKEEYENKYKHFLIKEGDVVIASSGNTYGKTAKILDIHLPLLMNTSVIRFNSKNRKIVSQVFLEFFLKSKQFKNQIEQFVVGSAQPNFGPSHLKMMKICLPTQPVMIKVTKILKANTKQIKRLTKKNQNLIKTRDHLLPKLISGKVDVSELDIDTSILDD